jgi:hypothetical protein
MNKLWLKTVMMPLLGLAAFGLSQTAAASWVQGQCAERPNPDGPVPCIEHKDANGMWWHFNGEGDHTNIWHGYPINEDGQAPEEPFTFCGQSSLSCTVGGIPVDLDCTLCLDGYVKKFQDDDNNWLIGVKVTGGTVSPGDGGCDDITLGGFPWYAGDNQPAPGNEHDNFGEHSGVPYAGSTLPGMFTGNFGAIDITYTLFGIPVSLVTSGHVHSVDFNNNGGGMVRSDFQFGLASTTGDDIIYEDGNADTDSGCTVSGTLTLDPDGEPMDINIW